MSREADMTELLVAQQAALDNPAKQIETLSQHLDRFTYALTEGVLDVSTYQEEVA